MDKLICFLMSSGSEVPIISIAIVILTGLIKMPVKRIANNMNYPKKVTRYIILLPVVLGFGLTALFMFINRGAMHFTDEFYDRWFSAVSLSLAFYAVWEKFVPSEKKILSEAVIRSNKELIKDLKVKLINYDTTEEVAPTKKELQTEDDSEELKAPIHKRIILTNHKSN